MTYECIGRYATNPYYIDDACLNIFSIEELCWYIKNNVYFLEDTFASHELNRFISSNLGLTELADELEQMTDRQGSMPDYVCAILRYADFATDEEMEDIRRTLDAGNELSAAGKRKIRGDHFMTDGVYPSAVTEYMQALQNADDEMLRCRIYHNLGTAFAKMFLFDNAAGYFMKSYEISRSDSTYEEYLAALKMKTDKDDYIRLVSDGKISGYAAEAVEKNFTDAEARISRRPEHVMYMQALKLKNDGKISEYDKKTDALINDFKTQYIKCRK